VVLVASYYFRPAAAHAEEEAARRRERYTSKKKLRARREGRETMETMAGNNGIAAHSAFSHQTGAPLANIFLQLHLQVAFFQKLS
jgi:hypothetical protein